MKRLIVPRVLAISLSFLFVLLLFIPRSTLSTQDIRWKSYETIIFSFQDKELKQWNPDFVLQSSTYFPRAADLITFSATPETFYWINERNEGFIHAHNAQEIIPFGPFGEPPFNWKNPVDMSISHNQLFVLDRSLPSIECFDHQGNHLRSILLPESLQPRYLSYRNDRLYLSDERSRSAIVMDLEGFKLHQFGKKGSSRGMMQAVGQIWVDASSNVYIHDPLSLKLTCFPSFTHIPWQITYPHQNFAVSDNKIAYGTPNARTVEIQELPSLNVPVVQALPYLLDFGSIPIGKAVSRSLLILTSNVQNDQGTFSAEVPYIRFSDHQVHPHAHQVTVTITLPENYLDQQWSQMIKFHQDKKPALCVAVQAKGIISDFPSISIGGFSGITRKDFYLPIKMEDKLGHYHYTLTGLPGYPVNVVPLDDIASPLLKISSEGDLSPGYFTAKLTIIPYEKHLSDPPFRSLVIDVPIYIRASEDYIPRETLMEGFDAVWLIKSPMTQEATLKLKKALYPYPLTNIRYYLETAGKVPELEDTAQSKQRIRWYQSDLGLPTYYFNGTHPQKGIPTGEDTRTEEGRLRTLYKAFLSRYLKDFNAYAPFAFDCSVDWSSASEGKVTIKIISDKVTFSPALGLNVVLLRKYIYAQTISGATDHYDVFQKFLTPVENQFFGIELNSENIKNPFSIPISLAAPDSSLYDLIIFIQDQKSKEVLQSLRIEF